MTELFWTFLYPINTIVLHSRATKDRNGFKCFVSDWDGKLGFVYALVLSQSRLELES